MPRKVPVATIVKIERPRVLHHGLEQGIFLGLGGRFWLFSFAARRRAGVLFVPGLREVYWRRAVGSYIWVIEIHIGQNRFEKRFGAVKPIFDGFNVLWRGIPSSIGRLIVRAVCVRLAFTLLAWRPSRAGLARD